MMGVTCNNAIAIKVLGDELVAVGSSQPAQQALGQPVVPTDGRLRS
jgi:hypothetical protein